MPFARRSQGILFVLSGPSGAGKTTLREGLRRFGDFEYSVSCTTRAPRPGERDGVDYHFLSTAEFERRLAAGEFLEHAEVHGARYGTLRETVLQRLAAGVDVLLDIDIQGAAMLRQLADASLRNCLADVFLMPPGLDALQRRLAHRATETSAQRAVRLENALREMRHWHEYRYTLLSGTPEEDLARFRAIMTAERQLSRRLALDLA